MIEIHNVNKKFGSKLVLEDVNLDINAGTVLGLIGPNGAGKSTLLRLISGVLEVDAGIIYIDKEDIYDNANIKKDIIFLGDEPYFFAQSNMMDMKEFYQSFYPNFDDRIFQRLIREFNLDPYEKINNFSKGMKRQVSVVLAFSSQPKILLLDEVFDGLDPLMRFKLKQIISEKSQENDSITIISSHNLHELEDICDQIAIIEKNSIRLNHSTSDLHKIYHRFHLAFDTEKNENIFSFLNPLKIYGNKKIFTIILKGDIDSIYEKIKQLNPLICETSDLSLEEIYIYEMEGYIHEKFV